MKKSYLSLFLVFVSFCGVLSGCFKKDLTDYEKVGYSWVLSCDGSDYYKVTFTSYSDNTVYIDLEICNEHLEDEYIYFYSVGIELECNGKRYEEILVPFIYPIGMYQVPVESTHLTLTLIADDKVNGYLMTRLDSQPAYTSDTLPLKLIKFSIY